MFSPRPRLNAPNRQKDLALGAAHGGRFVTFDRTLSLAAVYGAAEKHLTVL